MTDSQESKVATLEKSFEKAKGNEPNKNTSEVVKYKFDKLKMYFGKPYTVKGSDDFGISIYSPTIGDIIDAGEDRFYSTLYCFIGNPTTYRLQLWDMGIDWNKIDDFELFAMLLKTVDSEICQMLFGDITFSNFNLYADSIRDEQVLIDVENNHEITKSMYLEMREYLRTMFNINPKSERAKGKTTKQWIIDEEREKVEAEKAKKNPTSTLLPMISFCVNHPGFKYKTKELEEIGIVQFMDSVQRLQIYEGTRALNAGLYSGMADLSKVPTEQFNFMRDISI